MSGTDEFFFDRFLLVTPGQPHQERTKERTNWWLSWTVTHCHYQASINRIEKDERGSVIEAWCWNPDFIYKCREVKESIKSGFLDY